MDKKSFEKLVVRVLERLPQVFSRKMENVEIIIEDLAGKEVLKEMGLPSPYYIFGLYRGIPKNKRGFHYSNVLPDTITLFQKAIESVSKNEKAVERKVQQVIIHELGHHFGFTERALRKLGY
jgi:predicted Zn-dependent protease with MMP-like domain